MIVIAQYSIVKILQKIWIENHFCYMNIFFSDSMNKKDLNA